MRRENPVYSKGYLLEYLLVGFLAAVGFWIFMFLHIRKANYESSYLLYIGNAIFGAIIMIYNIVLIRRSYLKKRAVSMMLSAHLATLAGTILSMILSLVTMVIYYPGILSGSHSKVVLEDAPAQTPTNHPAGWLFMILVNALILNFAFGSFVSIVSSYAGKRDQTTDYPAHLGKKKSNGLVTNDPPDNA